MAGPTTLLEGSRTAHSALKSLLNIQSNETPTCNILKNFAMAKVLQHCKLIVWDEWTMAHKKSLVALKKNYERSAKQSEPICWSDDFVSKRFSSNTTSDSTSNSSGWNKCMFNFDRSKSVRVASVKYKLCIQNILFQPSIR